MSGKKGGKKGKGPAKPVDAEEEDLGVVNSPPMQAAAAPKQGKKGGKAAAKAAATEDKDEEENPFDFSGKKGKSDEPESNPFDFSGKKSGDTEEDNPFDFSGGSKKKGKGKGGKGKKASGFMDEDDNNEDDGDNPFQSAAAPAAGKGKGKKGGKKKSAFMDEEEEEEAAAFDSPVAKGKKGKKGGKGKAAAAADDEDEVVHAVEEHFDGEVSGSPGKGKKGGKKGKKTAMIDEDDEGVSPEDMEAMNKLMAQLAGAGMGDDDDDDPDYEDGEDIEQPLPSIEAWAHVFGDKLTGKNKKKVPTKSLDGKVVGLYFSASFAPSCLIFTPILAEAYNKIKQMPNKPADFEIVFVSWDKTSEQFKAALDSMPWLAAKFDQEQNMELGDMMNVRALPTLVLYDQRGNPITSNGVALLEEDGVEGFPWKPQEESLIRELTVLTEKWQEGLSLLLMMEEVEGKAQEKIAADYKFVAEAEKAYAEKNPLEPAIKFFVATRKRHHATNMRDLLKLKDMPCLLLLDFEGDGHKYVCDSKELNKETMQTLLTAFHEQKLEPRLVSAVRPEGDCDPKYPGVKIVVADSFKELVLKPVDKAVLFHAFTAESQEARYHIHNVAKVLKDMNVDLVVADFNNDENELDSLLMSGDYEMPYIFYFPPGDRTLSVFNIPFVRYSEDHFSGEAILRFIETQCGDMSEHKLANFNMKDATARLQLVLQANFAAAEKDLREVWSMATGRAFAEGKEEAPKSLQATVTAEQCWDVLEELGITDESQADIRTAVEKFFKMPELDADNFIAFWRTVAHFENVELEPSWLLHCLRQELAVPAANKAGLCTFKLTEKEGVKQDFFWCVTCSDEPGTGCCGACARICHAGHELMRPDDDEDNFGDDYDDDDGHGHSHHGHNHGHGHSHGHGHGHSDQDDEDEAPKGKKGKGGKKSHAHDEEEDEVCDDDECGHAHGGALGRDGKPDLRTTDCYCDCGAGSMKDPCKALVYSRARLLAEEKARADEEAKKAAAAAGKGAAGDKKKKKKKKKKSN